MVSRNMNDKPNVIETYTLLIGYLILLCASGYNLYKYIFVPEVPFELYWFLGWLLAFSLACFGIRRETEKRSKELGNPHMTPSMLRREEQRKAQEEYDKLDKWQKASIEGEKKRQEERRKQYEKESMEELERFKKEEKNKD